MPPVPKLNLKLAGDGAPPEPAIPKLNLGTAKLGGGEPGVVAPLLLERALLLAAQLEDEALQGRRVVVDEAALAVPLLARPALAAGAPRLALLDLAAAPRALGAALALAHRALVLRSEALSAPLAV